MIVSNFDLQMRWRALSHTIRKYSKQVNGFHVGIVGAGPAGFYCAQQLLKVTNFSFINVFKQINLIY